MKVFKVSVKRGGELLRVKYAHADYRGEAKAIVLEWAKKAYPKHRIIRWYRTGCTIEL